MRGLPIQILIITNGDIAFVGTFDDGQRRIILAQMNGDSTPIPEPSGLDGDVDGSGCVDTTDLDIVVSCFGQTAPLFPPCDDADVSPPPNGDGIVNILDISLVGSNLGNGCP